MTELKPTIEMLNWKIEVLDKISRILNEQNTSMATPKALISEMRMRTAILREQLYHNELKKELESLDEPHKEEDKCLECGGKGKYINTQICDFEIPCEDCHGTGKQEG